jgi:hypothetical protein
MTTPNYLAATQPNATLFVAPIFPGYLPVVQGTQAQISDQVQAHNKNLRKWKEHKNVTKALLKQLTDSVDPAYIAHLEDPYSGFNKVPVKNMLLDLFDNYGKIQSTNLTTNNKRFDEDWDPTETFQPIMAQVKQCCEFANDAGQLYSEEQILAKTHAIVFHLLAYQAIFGPFDYNRHPLMPLGTKVVVHEKPGQQANWDPHGKLGWYLGLALEHYCCHRCHITSTNSKRIANTVEFFLHANPIPKYPPRSHHHRSRSVN